MSIESSGYYVGTFHNDAYRYVDDMVNITGEKEVFELDEDHVNLVWRINDSDGWEFGDFKDVRYLSGYLNGEEDISIVLDQKLVVGSYYWAYIEGQWEPAICFLHGAWKRFRRVGDTAIYLPPLEEGKVLRRNRIVYLGPVILL